MNTVSLAATCCLVHCRQYKDSGQCMYDLIRVTWHEICVVMCYDHKHIYKFSLKHFFVSWSAKHRGVILHYIDTDLILTSLS
jgi:hypothetical protein